MKKDPIAKRIEKEFAARAAEAPRRPVDPAALEEQVRQHREKVAAREARAAELQAAMAEAAPAAASVETVLPEVMEKFAELRGKLAPAGPEQLRAAALREDLHRMELWGFPRRYLQEITAWNCLPQQRVYEKCREMLAGVGAIVALIGKRGTGKTTIAAQLALDRLRWERAQRATRPGLIVTFLYKKTTGLVGRFKPLYANFGAINQEALEESRGRLCGRETDVLVIDELHDLSELAVREALLIDMIDRRYAARRDTLIISNQTPEEFERETPASIRSRIREHGLIIPCEWQSWRDER